MESEKGMPEVQISEVVWELLERHAGQSPEYDSVEALIEAALTEFLGKHDRFGRLHVPLPTLLMSAADDISEVRGVIDTIDWYDTSDPVETALSHLSSAEKLLRDAAQSLAKRAI